MNECKVCNGAHVYHCHGKGFTAFMTCYECGPVTAKQAQTELEQLRREWQQKALEVTV